MKIISCEIRHLEIPLRTSFSHASATRKMTDSVLILLRSENGFLGFGEGCPRSYVTGETWESAQQFFESFKSEFQKIQTIDDLQGWVLENKDLIDQNPAVWCAIELAILDLLGKESNQTIEELLLLPKLSGEFHYSAVIGTKHMFTFFIQAVLYKLKGFTDFKIKIFGDFKSDRWKIRFLKFIIGSKMRLRLDANNLWKDPKDATHYIKKLNCLFFATEEPVTSGEYEMLSVVGRELKTNIILDESFLRIGQFEKLEKTPARWIINVRISKMGGLIRTKMICEEAQRRKIPIIIGAQVGETSILTRVSLSVANAYRDIVLAQEGAFGTYLLETDPLEPSLCFGYEGALSADRLVGKEKFGLGLLLKRGQLGIGILKK